MVFAASFAIAFHSSTTFGETISFKSSNARMSASFANLEEMVSQVL